MALLVFVSIAATFYPRGVRATDNRCTSIEARPVQSSKSPACLLQKSSIKKVSTGHKRELAFQLYGNRTSAHHSVAIDTVDARRLVQDIPPWRDIPATHASLDLHSVSGARLGLRASKHYASHQARDGSTEAKTAGNQTEVPARRVQMLFRPVSVTMYCVIWLSLQTLLAHTCLAIARNLDELSGMVQPSKTTLVLAVACRTSQHAPVMCMLFLANRMRVLALTHGSGEPEGWVKACEVLSCVGFTGRFVLLLFTGLATENEEQPERDTSARQVLRRSMTVTVVSPSRRSVFTKFMHVITLGALYGGLFGIAASMLKNPDILKTSQAVSAAAALGVLYFLVEWHRLLGTYFADTSCYVQDSISEELDAAELRAEAAGDYYLDSEAKIARPNTSSTSTFSESSPFTSRKIQAALTAASNVAQKAPMWSVLFLAARVRHLQVSPPDGVPPYYIGIAFIVAPCAIFLEILVSFYIGWTGTEESGYYRAKVYRSSWFLHLAQHFCGFIALGTVGTTMGSIFFHWGGASVEPLSTTMLGVLALCMIYFTVCGGLWFGGVARDIFGRKWQTFQNTLSAAGVSVAFSPMLSVLFVACRVRALQISDQKGNPPWWSQDCLDMIVSAVIVQSLCCLALPIFSGRAISVDSEGNVLYDVRPMAGAHAVTIVKYVALLSLHAGVVGIAIAICIMTPEMTSQSQALTEVTFFRTCVRGCSYMLLALVLAFVLSSAKVIGLAVKFTIESVDEVLLGINVAVDRAALCLCHGFVNVRGLVALNPKDLGFTSGYLLRVGHMRVKINMGRLVLSLGKVFEVTELALEGVELNYEKSGVSGSSNVKTVLKFMETYMQAADTHGIVQQSETPSNVQVDIKRLLIRDITANITFPRFGKVAQVRLGDLDIPDFMSRITKHKRKGASALVVFVMQTILKTAASNLEVISALAKEGAKQAVTIAAINAKACGGSALALCRGESYADGHGCSASSSSSNGGKKKRRHT